VSAESLRDELLRKLAVLPKPVEPDQAIECARSVLPGPEFNDFQKWFAVNGATLLERVNA